MSQPLPALTLLDLHIQGFAYGHQGSAQMRPVSVPFPGRIVMVISTSISWR
jgi:hypothetical protein